MTLPWREVEGDLDLAVRLTPCGGAARIEGLAEEGGLPVLRVRVPAPPVAGAANAALTAFLAKALGLPKSAVTLQAGARSRIKRLRLQGEGLGPRLAALATGARDG
jgi:uncharacterized protein YggU (UPF0235/DUF167 family)